MHKSDEDVAEISTQCLDEAARSLAQVGRNLSGFLHDLSAPPLCIQLLEPDLQRLDQGTRNLRANIEFLLESRRQSDQFARTAMAGKLSELEELKMKYSALQRDNEKAHSQIAVLQGETARLRSQLQHQSAFCASLGAVLGNLIWKASRVPPVVDLFLSGNKVADFLCIVSGTLESFLETFDTVMPGPTADESQFIMAMGGTVTNMAAAPTGRQFLVSDPNGRDLILQVIRILPVIPTPSGNCLKRLLLMALYNVSINQAGLSLLQEEGKGTIFTVVSDCLPPQSSNELRTMALRLLLSLTCEINDAALLSKVPKERIAQISHSGDVQLQTMAEEVLENINKAEERIRQSSCKSNASQQSPPPLKSSDPESKYERTDKPQMQLPTAAWRLPSHT